MIWQEISYQGNKSAKRPPIKKPHQFNRRKPTSKQRLQLNSGGAIQFLLPIRNFQVSNTRRLNACPVRSAVIRNSASAISTACFRRRVSRPECHQAQALSTMRQPGFHSPDSNAATASSMLAHQPAGASRFDFWVVGEVTSPIDQENARTCSLVHYDQPLFLNVTEHHRPVCLSVSIRIRFEPRL